jgi:hypothetical protein
MTTHPKGVKVVAIGPITGPGPVPVPTVEVRGMFGIGDCLFQRAVLRGLIEKHPNLVLDSYYRDMFWDFERDGLRINIVKDRGRIRDSENRTPEADKHGIRPIPLRYTQQIRLTYDKDMILSNGSILAAMFKSAGLTMPPKPDFSMPVKPEWVARWRLFLMQECARRGIKVTKPIAVYRPIVLNTGWTAPARAPDPKAYLELWEAIKDKFFVVSIADLKDKGGNREWIVGREPRADLCLHRGELDFAALCGLFKDAKLAFTNPGFAPVLAHAVGTPVVIVYGGNESFATTNLVGAHLSPTLAIDIDKPCACHSQIHLCNKTITIPPAKKRLIEFTKKILGGVKVNRVTPQDVIATTKVAKPRILIFGTCYVDTPEREELTRMWYELHSQLNPGCDLMLIDSASPLLKLEKFGAVFKSVENSTAGWMWRIATEHDSSTHFELQKGFWVYQFKDNIGHLSRNGPKGPNSSGADGWGRAFSKGLDIACQKSDPSPASCYGGYDYVVHIEGDSLFKHPVLPVIERMIREGIKVLTVPVKGTKSTESGWAETGLMFFETKYLRESNFTRKYDWANRKPSPTPERVIFDMLKGLEKQFCMMSWAAMRGDKNQVTADHIQNLDWVTHVRNKAGLDDVKLFRKYVDKALNLAPLSADVPPSAAVGSHGSGGTVEKPPTPPVEAILPTGSNPTLRINLGCGTNRLAGWQNHDKDVDITRKLPFRDASADYIFAEHVVEHIAYYHAINFMKECLRVLKPRGVLRLTTPSLEFLQARGDDEYFKWTHERGWAPTADRRGAMHAILYCHGHQTAWTSSLLMSTMYYCGFEQTAVCEIGKSKHQALVGVEGHSRVIGEHFNWIESLCVEGTKP